MAVSTQTVVRAQCDACPQVQYADAPAQPAGFHLVVDKVDASGQVTQVAVFACQPNHVGAAVKKVLQVTKPGTRLGQVAEQAPVPPVTPPVVRPTVVPNEADKSKDQASKTA